jgi:hypothetical protein
MRRPLLVALLVLCLAPASAGAEVSDFGSDLSLPANVAANHGADTSYWNVGSAPPLGSYTAPADGQVSIVKLKGALLPNDRMRNTEAEKLAQIIHFQVLRDKGDGSYKVVLLSTGHLEMPIADEKAAQELVTTYRPVNLCVKAGDTVAFNTIGAHEYRRPTLDPNYQGAEYQVFGIAPDRAVQWYEKDNGLNEGTTIQPSPNNVMFRHELLMRTTLSTGPDATDICPGGYAQHIFKGLEFKDHPKPTVRTKTRTARAKIFCHFENYGGCLGTLSLDATLNGVPTRLGEIKFNVPHGHTHTVEIPLSQQSVLAIQGAKKVTGTLTADARDNPRGDDRVKWDSVPVQQKTSTDQIVLEADKPACVVPNVIGKSSSSAKASVRKAGCASAVKYKKGVKAKQVGKIVAVSPAPGTVLPSGSKVTLTIGKRK